MEAVSNSIRPAPPRPFSPQASVNVQKVFIYLTDD
jgi:hypothetical protein